MVSMILSMVLPSCSNSYLPCVLTTRPSPVSLCCFTFSSPLALHRSARLVALSAPPNSSIKDSSVSDGMTEENLLQLIRSHQERAARLSPIEEIRTFLDCSRRGILSTFSQKYEGYPSNSMVDFACDVDGSPILAISSLAAHSKDLQASPKCALLIARDPDDRSDLTVTLYGDAVPVPEERSSAVRTAYLAKHPNAIWVDFGDFYFVRVEPKSVRYVTGIASASLGTGEFSRDELAAAKVDPISQFSKAVTNHMNKDHGEDTKMIVRHATSIPVDSAAMLDVDSLGFNVKAVIGGNSFKLRIPFPRRAEDRKDMKTLIVQLLQDAKTGTV